MWQQSYLHGKRWLRMKMTMMMAWMWVWMWWIWTVRMRNHRDLSAFFEPVPALT
jgi:hypothetical protein